MDRLRDTLPSAWTATTRGEIRFRQTTYWDVVTDGESRATRVHFIDKLEFRFTAASFVGIELTNQHPVLLDHTQEFDQLFVGSPPHSPDRAARDIAAQVNAWSGGWRAFDRYGNSPSIVDSVLRAGYGCLMHAPRDLARLVEQGLVAHGAQCTVLPWARRTGFDPLLLRFGTNFVIARHFEYEEHPIIVDQHAGVSVQQRFFERLERAAPELRSLRTEHEADHGEILGHLLMFDIFQWACATVDSKPAVDAVLEEMARSLQPGDDPVSNMISVSFLENLIGANDPRELAIRARLPGKLRVELGRMEAWQPGSADPEPDWGQWLKRDVRVLHVELYFLRTDEGGRASAVDLSDGRYRTIAATGVHDSFESTQVLAGDERQLFGIALRRGPSTVHPGSVARAELIALVHPPAIDYVAAAGAFTVFEGHTLVARGIVIGHEAG